MRWVDLRGEERGLERLRTEFSFHPLAIEGMTWPRIFELERRLVIMRKVLSPQRDTMVMLGRRGDARVSERTSHYFRDVHDQLVR